MPFSQISGPNNRYRVILAGLLAVLLIASFTISPASAIEEGVTTKYTSTSFETFPSTEVRSVQELTYFYGPLLSESLINITLTITGSQESQGWFIVDITSGAIVDTSYTTFNKDNPWVRWRVGPLVEGLEMKTLAGNDGKVVGKKDIEVLGMTINAWELVWRSETSSGSPVVHTAFYSDNGLLLRGQFESGGWTSLLVELTETNHSFKQVEEPTTPTERETQPPAVAISTPEPTATGDIPGPALISETESEESTSMSPLLIAVVVIVVIAGIGAVVALKRKKK